MSAPKRIQRQRTRGWRMPVGAVYVGRPTRWGNPFVVHLPEVVIRPETGEDWYCPDNGAREQAVEMYRAWMVEHLDGERLIRDLAGRDLACWCPLDQPCHADVLLEVANR